MPSAPGASPEEVTSARSGRSQRIRIIAVATVLPLSVLATYEARRAFIGDRTVCVVTASSLAADGASGEYDGVDHPEGPQVGDRYVGSSGCLRFETECRRVIEVLGTRDEC